jgi:hypothetical protein
LHGGQSVIAQPDDYLSFPGQSNAQTNQLGDYSTLGHQLDRLSVDTFPRADFYYRPDAVS